MKLKCLIDLPSSSFTIAFLGISKLISPAILFDQYTVFGAKKDTKLNKT